MFKIVTIARTNIIEIFPVDYPHDEAPWDEVSERLMDNVYEPAGNRIELKQVDYNDYSEYYMEIDIASAPNDFQQILQHGLDIMKAYLHDYGFDMKLTQNQI